MMEPKYGWLDALAEATHQPYHPNNTGGGPSIKVRNLLIFFFIREEIPFCLLLVLHAHHNVGCVILMTMTLKK